MKRTLKFTAIATVTTILLGGVAFAAQHKESGGMRGDRAERMFERMDADKDGKVTLEEVKAQATERFARRDIDGDGIVSRADMRAMRVNRRAERFAAMDADGDGLLSKAEFSEFVPERAERRERRKMRGKRDARRMGRNAPLTIQEVEARATRRFERMDADEKGYVTLDDVKSAMKDRRGRR